MNRIKWQTALLGLFSVISMCAVPSIFLYCQNIKEIYFSDIRNVLFISIGIGIALFLLCSLVLKNISAGAIVASLVMAICLNYKFVQNFVQIIFVNAKYWHIVPAILILMAALIVVFKNVSENLKSLFPDVVLCLAIALTVMNLINIVPAIFKQGVSKQEEVEQVAYHTEGIGNRKNIYWIILDECADFETMKYYYDYSDPTFQNELEKLGFTVSDASYNEAHYTDVVLTNCICLDYVVDSTMEFTAMKPYRQNGALYKLLHQNGYSINGIGETEWLAVPSLTAEGASQGKTISGQTGEQLIVDMTILSPFFQRKNLKDAQTILNAFSYLENPENFKANSSSFHLTYLCAPHAPFLFDNNGGDVSIANYDNWADKQYYRNQFIYTMQRTVTAATSIIENDPDAVIIIGSDHGPRQVPGMTDPHEKQRVLLAVYDGGMNAEQYKNKSTLNVLRMIIGRETGADLPELEVPNYV